jgi:hypothetical protein
MFEKFNHYSDLKWMAAPAAQTIGPGDKIQTYPDIHNFKLERFKDLRDERTREDDEPFKVMLIGSSKTNVFIYGPDSLVTILLIYLPRYVGKSWSEIQDIKFEEVLLHCRNFLINNRCNPWIIEKFE